jgi:hypothetical protein
MDLNAVVSRPARNDLYRVIRHERGQQNDHAYHEDRLLLLIDQRARMTGGSDQIPALDIEIMAVWDLVRCYRLLEAMQAL